MNPQPTNTRNFISLKFSIRNKIHNKNRIDMDFFYKIHVSSDYSSDESLDESSYDSITRGCIIMATPTTRNSISKRDIKTIKKLEAAIMEENIEKYKEIIDKKPHLDMEVYNNLVTLAAKYDKFEFIDMFCESGINNVGDIGEEAAKHGNMETVKKLLNYGGGYDKIARGAAEYGDLEMVKMIVEMGANDYDVISEGAAKSSNLDIIKYLINNGLSDISKVISIALEYGNMKLVNYILDTSNEYKNDVACYAIANKNMELFHQMIKRGANGFDDFAVAASIYANKSVLDFLFSKDIELPYDDMMFYANSNIIEYIKEKIKNRTM